jgi:hypothetical protein
MNAPVNVSAGNTSGHRLERFRIVIVFVFTLKCRIYVRASVTIFYKIQVLLLKHFIFIVVANDY